jgi:hypothetical protein
MQHKLPDSWLREWAVIPTPNCLWEINAMMLERANDFQTLNDRGPAETRQFVVYFRGKRIDNN